MNENEHTIEHINEQENSFEEQNVSHFEEQTKLNNHTEKPKSSGMDKEVKQIIWMSIGLIAIIGVLMLIGKCTSTPEILTLDDMIAKTLAGEETEDNFLHNGFVFVRVGDLWYTQLQREEYLFEIPLHFNPRQVANITVEGEINEKEFNDAEHFYITFDPAEDGLDYVALSAAELSLNMARAMSIAPVAACSKNETETCYSRPIVDCNTDAAVVYLKEAEPTQITLNGTCITIQGDRAELLRATDRIILQWYGMI